MRARLVPIAAVLLALAMLPAVIRSDFWLTWMTLVLFYAFIGQAWNVLGGYGGQFSFGNVLFFGWGAYVTSLLQIKAGVNAWLGFAAATAAGALVGLVVGYLVFRYRLRGSYFALVTLAFAEVFRIVANTLSFTGGGVGLLVPLAPSFGNMQFADKAGYYWCMVALLAVGLLLSAWIESSRFGARLMAVRENEDAARAIGVRAQATKLQAIAISGAMTGAAGALYVQMNQFIDPSIAFSTGISIEAVLVPIVGGIGTVFGPLLGSFVLHGINEVGREILGELPGLTLILYGILLVLIIRLMPSGIVGWLSSVRTRRGRAGRVGRPGSEPPGARDHA